MKKFQFIILVICAVIVHACVTTQAVRLGRGPIRPPVPWDQVIIYRTADQVPGKYEEIALLTASGDSMWTKEEEMYKEMRKKAGKLGANAIILDAMSEPSASTKVISYVLLGVGGERRGKALAIYVFPEKE
ncbi:MAG: hypothetical protein QME85_01550 [Candidatus Saccharicenans sp.]|nr:hypothetical protein [Candidatus Saccharicenans sp.]